MSIIGANGSGETPEAAEIRIAEAHVRAILARAIQQIEGIQEEIVEPFIQQSQPFIISSCDGLTERPENTDDQVQVSMDIDTPTGLKNR